MLAEVAERRVVDFDLHSPEFARNWRAKLIEMHRIGPVLWSNAHGGFWIILDRDLCEAAAKDWETFSSLNIPDGVGDAPRGIMIPPLSMPLTLNEQDPPEWVERRMLEAKFFTPLYLRKWGTLSAAYLDEAIDEVIANGGGEFVHDIGLKVPAKTALAVIGEDPADWDAYVRPAHKIARVPADSPEYPYLEMAGLHQRLCELVLDRRENPRDDMASALARARVGGKPLETEVAAGMLLTVATGGFDTATAMLSHSFIWLGDHKDLWPGMLADDAAMRNAMDELFRAFPSTHGTARNVRRDIEMGGQLLRRGDRVLLSWGAANYDAKHFESPEEIRLDRPNANRHLTFGAGGHRCLGSPLARVEVRAVLTAVMTRLPNYVVDKERIRYFEQVGLVNGVECLPFTLG